MENDVKILTNMHRTQSMIQTIPAFLLTTVGSNILLDAYRHRHHLIIYNAKWNWLSGQTMITAKSSDLRETDSAITSTCRPMTPGFKFGETELGEEIP